MNNDSLGLRLLQKSDANSSSELVGVLSAFVEQATKFIANQVSNLILHLRAHQ